MGAGQTTRFLQRRVRVRRVCSDGNDCPPAERPERVLHDSQPRHDLIDLVERAVRARLNAARE